MENNAIKTIDEIITDLEKVMEASGKTIIRLSTALNMLKKHINLDDPDPFAQELMIDGAKVTIKERLRERGYIPIVPGLFTKMTDSEKARHLETILWEKEMGMGNKLDAVVERLDELAGIRNAI